MTIPPGHRFEATQAVRQVLARAVSWGLLDVNPAKLGVENPQRRYTEKRPFDSWEEQPARNGGDSRRLPSGRGARPFPPRGKLVPVWRRTLSRGARGSLHRATRGPRPVIRPIPARSTGRSLESLSSSRARSGSRERGSSGALAPCPRHAPRTCHRSDEIGEMPFLFVHESGVPCLDPKCGQEGVLVCERIPGERREVEDKALW
jgi:hypothetical protein